MKAINKFLFAGLPLLLLTSCSNQLTYFTQDVYENYRFDEGDLKRVQFYLSRDIRLRRDFDGGSAQIQNGRIILENGRQIEEVIIPRGTPGVYLFSPKSNRFAICFEDNDENFLVFGPSPKYDNRYVLMASEWERDHGIVTYAGKRWQVSSEEAYAALMVDLRKLEKLTVDRKVVKGRKVRS